MSRTEEIEQTLEQIRQRASETAQTLRYKMKPKEIARSALSSPAVRKAGDVAVTLAPVAAISGLVFLVWRMRRRRAQTLWPIQTSQSGRGPSRTAPAAWSRY